MKICILHKTSWLNTMIEYYQNINSLYKKHLGMNYNLPRQFATGHIEVHGICKLLSFTFTPLFL